MKIQKWVIFVYENLKINIKIEKNDYHFIIK